MAVFAIIAVDNEASIDAAIGAQYGANHFRFAPNTWFVSDVGNTKAVADKIGVTNGSLQARAVVLALTGYSGWATSSAWVWLQQFPETVSNG